MKKLFLIVLLVCVKQVNAQTNVSGGIYSNTTWSVSGSPYVVTDTVVVFPGVTLTIQPGVTVKFANNKGIEIRRATLIAIGTSTDSITFTSNAATPTAGIWTEINLNLYGANNINTKFDYCNFRYATNGVILNPGTADSVFIRNSSFSHNSNGVYLAIDCFIDYCNFSNNAYGINRTQGSAIVNHCVFLNNQTGIDMGAQGIIKNSTIKFSQYGINDFNGSSVIDSCIISNNQYGISDMGGNSYCTIKNSSIDSNSIVGIKIDEQQNDSIFHCRIIHNGIGLEIRGGNQNPPNVIAGNTIINNSTGFQFVASLNHNDTIYCNRICNNTTYDFYNNSNYNINIPHNYWCTSDSAATEAVIFDGYDNINYGLVAFMPMDSSCSPNFTTSIKKITSSNVFNIYPNPTSNQFIIETNINEKQLMQVFDINGKLVLSQNINGTTTVDASNLNAGVYNLTIKNSVGVTNKKLVIVK